jgi:hypothetical protein
VHDSVLVDHDHRIRHGIKDRREMSLARKGVSRAGGGSNAVTLQLLSAPGDARSDHREQSSIDDFRRRNAGRHRDDEEAEHDAEAGCQQSRSESAQAASGQNRGNEQQVG